MKLGINEIKKENHSKAGRGMKIKRRKKETLMIEESYLHLHNLIFFQNKSYD